MNYTVIVAEDEELLLNNLVHKIEKAEIVLFHLKHQPVTSDSSFIVGFDDK